MLREADRARVLDYLRSCRDLAEARGEPTPGVLASRVFAQGLDSDPYVTPDDVRDTLDELVGLGEARYRDQYRPAGSGEQIKVCRYYYARGRGPASSDTARDKSRRLVSSLDRVSSPVSTTPTIGALTDTPPGPCDPG